MQKLTHKFPIERKETGRPFEAKNEIFDLGDYGGNCSNFNDICTMNVEPLALMIQMMDHAEN